MRLFLKKGLLVVLMTLAFITLSFSNLITKADTNKNEAYEVKITSGIDGKYRALKYIPVTVEFTSLEKDFSGEVEIRTSGSYSSTYDAYSKEISVLKGESGKVTIPIKLLEGYSKITVNLVENGKVLFEKKSLISKGRVSESNLFMGVLTDDKTSLSYTGTIMIDNPNNPGYKGVIEKVELDEKIIGENSLNIDGLDIILINNYNMSNLKDEQYNTLNSWINKGGTLIIGSGANEGKTINNIDNNFLNIKSNGSQDKNVKLINDDLNLIISNLEIKDANLKSGTNETPLAYSVTRGKGEIIVTTFDLGLEPLISSKDAGEFFKSITADASNTFFQNSMNGGYYQQYYRASELTRNIPINKIVSVKSLIIVLSLYALIVGIISYLVLKKLNKRDLTWIAIPVISIAFTLIIYFMGSSTRVNDIVLNQNNIVSIDESGKASIKGYLGIGSKYKADVIIEKPEGLNMNYLTTDNYYYGNPDEETVNNILRVKTTYSGNNSYFTFSNSDALDMKTFEVVGKEEVISKIESSFNLSEGNLNGKVKNTLGYDIKKLIVIAGRNVWDIGSINKDEEKDFNDLKVAGANGLQAYSDNLSQKYYDAKWNKKGDLKSEEFENILRISGLIGAVSDGISINRDIKLIAITKLPIDYDINFNNKSISKFDTTAIIQDIDLDFKDKDGNYNFPDGYFDYRIESSSTNVHIDDYSGYIYGQGEVVFEYEIDENIEVLDLIIKQGIDRYGYSQGDNSEKYIYNYKTETYDKFLMSQGYEKIKDLENYIDNNTVKVKYIVTDSGKGGQSMIPRITIKGRDR